MWHLYLITNTKNGRQYAGQTQDPERRWSIHRSKLKARTVGCNAEMIADFHEHGVDAFTFEVVQSDIPSLNQAKTLENELIRSLDNPYNTNSVLTVQLYNAVLNTLKSGLGVRATARALGTCPMLVSRINRGLVTL